MQFAAALALFAAVAVAQQGSCPDGSTPSTNNGQSVCCNGILNSGSDGLACLTGCTLDKPPCFPFCSTQPNELTTSGTCTTVPVTASDYTQRVYGSASGSPAASGSGTPAASAAGTPAGSVTGSAGAAATTGASTVNPATFPGKTIIGSTGGSATATGGATSTTKKGGAAAAVTAAPALVLGALAGLAMI